MEPEGSIPNSQELSTCSYPEPDQSSPHHPIPPLQDSVYICKQKFKLCRYDYIRALSLSSIQQISSVMLLVFIPNKNELMIL
jgi:hypothetical protein